MTRNTSLLFAVHPDLLLPVLQIIHRAIATFLFTQTSQKRDQAVTGTGAPVATAPANIYMWRHPELFPDIPEMLLALRLVLQVILLWLIWWATRRPRLSATVRE